jgi:hypothetical protein
MSTRVIVAGDRILMLRKEADETERVFWNAAWRLAQPMQQEPEPTLEALEIARCWAYAREGVTYPARVAALMKS